MVHLFVHLLLSANHQPQTWQGIEVKTGQVVTGLKALRQNTGISTQKLRTCIKRLKSTGEITSITTNKYRIITLCKYKDYQIQEKKSNNQNNNHSNKQLTINQQSTNNQLTPNKNVKNEKNEKKRPCNNTAVQINAFIDYWKMKEDLPSIRSLTAGRTAKLRTRLTEPVFAEHWKEIIDKIVDSSFLMGENDRKWKADIDWIIKNAENYTKVMEGKYAGNSNQPKRPPVIG